MLRPIVQTGHDPVYSMGDDAPIAPLAGRPRPLASYFRQRFAQVTNPAIDHYRERTVMSVATLLGARARLDARRAAAPSTVLPGFLLYLAVSRRSIPSGSRPRSPPDDDLAPATERVADACIAEVGGGATLICLSDAAAGGDRAPIPSLLAVAACTSRLVEAGLRTVLLDRRERRAARHAHDRDPARLRRGRDLPAARARVRLPARAIDKIGGDRPSPDEAQRRARGARGRRPQGDVEDGHLGRRELPRRAALRGGRARSRALRPLLRRDASPIGGVGLDRLEADALRVSPRRRAKPELENPGFYKFRKGGEPHATDPEVVEALQAAVTEAHALRRRARTADPISTTASRLVNGRAPVEPRDLLELVPAGPPVPLEEVEPVEAIVPAVLGWRMSHGSLSAEAHETIAIALNRLGGSRTAARAARIRRVTAPSGLPHQADCFGALRRHRGVRGLRGRAADQDRTGLEAGRGRQIPAHKVTEEIARLRNTQPGVSLISPPPHHDIYSIEDLAQLIFDLREVNPEPPRSRSSSSPNGVGLIAVGVAKAHARCRSDRRRGWWHRREPAAVDQARGRAVGARSRRDAAGARPDGLRGRVRLRVDGGFKTGRDVLVAALLGADEYSFGTALLLAEGCLMVRSCHLDTCPVGIASQRPELRAKFAGHPGDGRGLPAVRRAGGS